MFKKLYCNCINKTILFVSVRKNKRKIKEKLRFLHKTIEKIVLVFGAPNSKKNNCRDR